MNKQTVKRRIDQAHIDPNKKNLFYLDLDKAETEEEFLELLRRVNEVEKSAGGLGYQTKRGWKESWQNH